MKSLMSSRAASAVHRRPGRRELLRKVPTASPSPLASSNVLDSRHKLGLRLLISAASPEDGQTNKHAEGGGKSADESAAIVYKSIQEYLRRHASDVELAVGSVSYLEELKATLQYHLGTLEALEGTVGPSLSKESLTRVLIVKYNVRMAIVTLDAYLDPGFRSRFALYGESSAAAAAGGEAAAGTGPAVDISSAAAARAFYPLRPRAVYAAVGERQPVLFDDVLDPEGFASSPDFEGMASLPLAYVQQCSRAVKYLLAYRSVQEGIASQTTTLERLKLELRLSAPPPSARDPTKKPRGSKSGSDGLSFTLGELYASGSAPAPAPVGFLFGRSLGAADEKALAVGFFQEVPLASQIADVEHCLKVWTRQRQVTLDALREVEAKVPPAFFAQGIRWASQWSMEAGVKKAEAIIATEVQGLSAFLVMNEYLGGLAANLPPALLAGQGLTGRGGDLPKPQPIDRSKLSPEDRASLAFTELSIYLAQYSDDGTFTGDSIKALSSEDLRKIEKDAPVLIAEFTSSRDQLPFYSSLRILGGFMGWALTASLMADVREELELRAQGKKPEPPARARTTTADARDLQPRPSLPPSPAFPSTSYTFDDKGPLSMGEALFNGGGAINANASPELAKLLDELDEVSTIPTQRQLDAAIAQTAALVGLLLAGTGGLVSSLWGVDPWRHWDLPGAATDPLPGLLSILLWTAPYLLLTFFFSRARQTALPSPPPSSSSPAAALAIPSSVDTGYGRDWSDAPDRPATATEVDMDIVDEAPPVAPVLAPVGGETVNLTAGDLAMQQPGFVLFRAEELPARIGLSGALLYFATTTLAETIFFRGVLLGSLVVVSRWGVLAGSPDLIGGGDLGIEEVVLSHLLGSLVPPGAPSHPVPLPLIFPFVALAAALGEAVCWASLNKWSGSKEYDEALVCNRAEQLLLIPSEGFRPGEAAADSLDRKSADLLMSFGLVVPNYPSAEPGVEPRTWVDEQKEIAYDSSARLLAVVARQLAVDIINGRRKTVLDVSQLILGSTFLAFETLCTGSLLPAFMTQLAGYAVGLKMAQPEVQRFRQRLDEAEERTKGRADELSAKIAELIRVSGSGFSSPVGGTAAGGGGGPEPPQSF